MSEGKQKKKSGKKKLKGKALKAFQDSRVQADQKEINQLTKRIVDEAPPLGADPLANDFSAPGSVAFTAVRKFEELPISQRTKDALTKGGFTHMTQIQRASIPHALPGRDVLGAARTGSGKTLAFLVPVLEILYRNGWTQYDGLGALIISPTRELAVQIFDVLRVVGKNHELSAGLVIGGKSFEEEAKEVAHMNILVATPGRLLQHMDQTPGFDCNNLKMLVVDEADRILDLGFERTLSDIVRNLPQERQTLLFSATQTKSVRALARLSLSNPQYINVHETSTEATPAKLSQHYTVVEAQGKFDLLLSFIKTHLKSKCIVFLSTCKQVRWTYEMFRRLRPGTPLSHLHGKMKQDKRMGIYYDFLKKESGVMFCTDLAARGLDFPSVDWVVQMDCPDSVETYIHRAGRTARYRAGGHALLFLIPSELHMATLLKEAKVPVSRVKANTSQLLTSTANQFQSFAAEDPELKYLSQKAFIGYIRSIHLASNKQVFDATKLDYGELATAMGLTGIPQVKFMSKAGGAGTSTAKREKNAPYQLQALLKGDQPKKEKLSAVEKILKRQNQTVLAESRTRLVKHDDEDNEDILHVKRRDHELEIPDFDQEDIKAQKKAKRNKERKLKKKQAAREQEEGEEEEDEDAEGNDSEEGEEEEDGEQGTEAEGPGVFLAKLKARLQAADPQDRETDRLRVKQKHRKRKLQEKSRMQEQRPRGEAPTLAMPDDDEENPEASDQDDDQDQDQEEQSEDDSRTTRKVRRKGRRDVEEEQEDDSDQGDVVDERAQRELEKRALSMLSA